MWGKFQALERKLDCLLHFCLRLLAHLLPVGRGKRWWRFRLAPVIMLENINWNASYFEEDRYVYPPNGRATSYFCLSVRQLVSLSQSVPKEKHFKQVRESVQRLHSQCNEHTLLGILCTWYKSRYTVLLTVIFSYFLLLVHWLCTFKVACDCTSPTALYYTALRHNTQCIGQVFHEYILVALGENRSVFVQAWQDGHVVLFQEWRRI